MDIQSLLGQAGPGQGMPPGQGGPPGMQQLLPLIMMMIQQMLGESGAMPQSTPRPQGAMPFASALGAGPGGPPPMPQMPPGLPR